MKNLQSLGRCLLERNFGGYTQRERDIELDCELISPSFTAVAVSSAVQQRGHAVVRS